MYLGPAIIKQLIYTSFIEEGQYRREKVKVPQNLLVSKLLYVKFLEKDIHKLL